MKLILTVHPSPDFAGVTVTEIQGRTCRFIQTATYRKQGQHDQAGESSQGQDRQERNGLPPNESIRRRSLGQWLSRVRRKVTQSGRKVFIVLSRTAGASSNLRKYTIGPYSKVTLHQARLPRRRSLHQLEGRDPAPKARRRKREVTIVSRPTEAYIAAARVRQSFRS